MRLDVLVFGGGAAGLWCLDRIRRGGYHAILLESKALGSGQTVQAQGIIHGGGKYALRGVRDFEAVRNTGLMPERWRRCLACDQEPHLQGARLLSAHCHLWLPRNSATAWLQSWGFVSLLAKGGVLAARPEKLPQSAWPEALRGSALAVYSMAEPVISTGSLLKALAARHGQFVFLYDAATLQISKEGVRIRDKLLQPRAIILAAGVGNAELLRKAGIAENLMQLRPLGMILLRGNLPALFGHCIVGGKTALTITTPASGLWQIGGEIAEHLAREKNAGVARAAALSAIHRGLPDMRFTGAEIAIYSAQRAEAIMPAHKRPSGVHASRVGSGIIVAWPTKLSMAPVLSDEVFEMVNFDLNSPGGYDEVPSWPMPEVARYPWEEAEWFAAR